MNEQIKSLAGHVLIEVERLLTPLVQRLEALEKQAPVKGEKGEQGKDGESVDLQSLFKRIDEQINTKFLSIPPAPPGPKGDSGLDGKDGQSIDKAAVSLELRTLVDEVSARIPVPRDGKDGRDGRDGVDGKDGVDGVHGKDGAAGLDGKNGVDGVAGKDGAPGVNGKDGVDGIHGKDGAPGLHGKDGEDGINGKDGADGINGKDGKEGINGKDGKDGVNGKDGSSGIQGQKGDRGDMGPRGDMGLDGLPGRDGVTLEDMDIELKDDRTLVFVWKAGPFVQRKEITLSIPLDEGVYKSDRFYARGSVTTYGGSAFIAKRDTNQTPGQGDDWRMMVKRGRDGKDAS